MSHEDDDAVIILFASQKEMDKLPEDKQEKIRAILGKANKEVDKVLEKNPNL